jgi:hypothetical protein
MAGTGGARPGAGRKTKAEKFATAIARAEKRIADRLPQLIDNLIALADGVTVQEVDKDGEAVIFTRPPDFKANEYLINRILGKPTEMIEAEVSGPGGGPIGIREVIVERPAPVAAEADE